MNTDDFMKLTIPEYSYMLAFIQCDGHLASGAGKKGRLQVELTNGDAHILEGFQKLTPYNSSISRRTRDTNFKKNVTSVRWTLCSLEAREKLKAVGMLAGSKSTSIAPPTGEYCVIDYVRGLIDADGAVGITGNSYPFISFTTKSDALANYMSDFLHRVSGVKLNPKRNTRDDIYNITLTNEPAQEVIKMLYYTDCQTLERKRALAEAALQCVRPEGRRRVIGKRRWQAHEDEVVRTNTIKDAARILERTTQSVNLRRWRLRAAD